MRSALVSLAAVALLAAADAPARADATDGVYLLASEHPSPVPNGLLSHTSAGLRYLVPGARLTSAEIAISAQDNANTTFAIGVQYAHPPGVVTGDQCTRAVLRLGSETLLSSGWGGDSDSCDTSFIVDAATAARAATLLHVTRLDRHPIGDRVVGTFATAQRSYRVGEPIEILLTMDNPVGSPSVAWVRGGANRGPRDDQFDFAVTRERSPARSRSPSRAERPRHGGVAPCARPLPFARASPSVSATK